MRLLVSIIGAILLAWSASAQIVPWKQVGGWKVMIDKSQRDGCFITFSGTRGTVIRIGYNDTRGLQWLMAHDAWKSLEVGKAYAMEASIDGKPYNGSMTGRDMGDRFVALFATFTEKAVAQQFLVDFMRGQRLRVAYGGRELAIINLQSSHAAGEQLQACQASIDNQPGPGNDPFAPRLGQPPQPTPDPFKQR